MCEIKRINGYACPKCHKIYKRKGKYLQAHLKACKQPAWIPITIVEFKMRKIEEEKFAEAIERIISGEFISAKKDTSEWDLAREKVHKEREFMETGATRGNFNDYGCLLTELTQYFEINKCMVI